MSAENDGDPFPRSMRHRQVLDAAEEHPDASIDEIASMVPSATADLVEHVFEEHGDPAADDEEQPESADTESRSEDDPAESTVTDEDTGGSAGESAADSPPADASASETADDGHVELSLEELSDRQRELLELVAARPEATQGELADHFDVTRATVSRWASDIEGFEWSDRASLVARAVDTPSAAVSTDGGSKAETAPAESESETPTVQDRAVEDFGARIDSLETRLADIEAAGSAEGGVDAELAHKIAHACLQSEAISEDEELRILEWLLQ